MVDLKSLEIELNQARQARIDAQAAISEVEDMIWQVQHVDGARPRFAFFVSGFEQAPAAAS